MNDDPQNSLSAVHADPFPAIGARDQHDTTIPDVPQQLVKYRANTPKKCFRSYFPEKDRRILKDRRSAIMLIPATVWSDSGHIPATGGDKRPR